MSTILRLETNGQEVEAIELCPGLIARIVATTDDGALVIWTENGSDAGSTPDNTFRVTARAGEDTEVTVSVDQSVRIVTVTGKSVSLNVDVPPGPHDGNYAITAEPAMPSIPLLAGGVGGNASAVGGNGVITFVANDCPPNGPADLRTRLDLATVDPGTLAFGGVMCGGSLSVDVAGTVEGCAVSGSATVTIGGTNPDRDDVRAALPHETLRAISCLESGQRQFDAPPDGGVARCPLFAADGGVGIMGIRDPSRDDVWNWRANLARGQERFRSTEEDARDYPRQVRESVGFRALVDTFNEERVQAGDAAIEVVLPDFSEGNFDDDLQQLERDTIRGYDGWFGTDLFGLPSHEYRVAMDTAGATPMLRVVDIDTATGTGRAEWEPVPASDRASGDPDYVDTVGTLLGGCLAMTVGLDASDDRTHVVPGKRLVLGAFEDRVHLVTVKGPGDVVLRATILPDTPATRRRVGWAVSGGTIAVDPANPLVARISRDIPTGVRIEGVVSAGAQMSRPFTVWVVWCTLAGNASPGGTSSLFATGSPPVGAQLGLALFADPAVQFAPGATIDWSAVVEPTSLCSNADRPALEDQVRVPPPVGADLGVPSATNPDATGSGFSGWDMSRQIRCKVFKADPGLPLTETTATDPVEFDRPVPTYPAVDVEGNDDTAGAGDEDDNPYDTGPGIPGLGRIGVLRSVDQPQRGFEHGEDQNGVPTVQDGHRYRLRFHYREFVRVQLGTTWYRCSDFGLWRWHMSARRNGGRWAADPAGETLIDLTNDGWA